MSAITSVSKNYSKSTNPRIELLNLEFELLLTDSKEHVINVYVNVENVREFEKSTP